jgi:dTDP-4-dehydrorhamnose reductase|tara:strand:- start:3650 stop:4537 length:888 start_codon:yes stop_codon:yes gene_type:complete
MLKLLVTGGSGLLGNEVIKLGVERGHQIHSIYNEHKINEGNPIQLDLIESNKIQKIVSNLKPDAIIHTAAYTDVDGCEVNKNYAWKANAEVLKTLTSTSDTFDTHLIYVSSDYVFDGENGNYSETDTPNPISYYGYTKLMGEKYVQEISTKWCIARTSVIYGRGFEYKLNFATWMIQELLKERQVKLLLDQFVSPTMNRNLAEMLLEIAERKITGIVHTSGATKVSRNEFGIKLSEKLNLDKNLVKSSFMKEMLWKAKRPRDSSLNVKKALVLLNAKPLKLDDSLNILKKELAIR